MQNTTLFYLLRNSVGIRNVFLQFLNALTMFQRVMISIILACAIGVTVLSLPETPTPMPFLGVDLPRETQTLAKNLPLIQQYAKQHEQIVGLHITAEGYQFMVQSSTSSNAQASAANANDIQWAPLLIQNCQTKGAFGKNVNLVLSLLGEQQNQEDERLGRSEPRWFDLDDHLAQTSPQIWILPSGEITPFSLSLNEQNKPADSRLLNIDQTGQITLSAPPQKQHAS